jgi:urea transport system ATP-binding protein
MTPELLKQGAKALADHHARVGQISVGSGDGAASYGRIGSSKALDTTQGVVLYVDGISVSFDGFKALNNLSLTINTGELRCIIGPNGAGKTTMMDVITGKTKPDQGSVFFGSTVDLLKMRESAIAQVGVGRKFQKPTVFEHLTVFENVELALSQSRKVGAALFAKLGSHHFDRIAQTLDLIHLRAEAKNVAGMLSHGQKQWLEIGMLLIQDPKLLLLDEPVAGMTDQETERTAELFLSLEGSHSLVVVEHDMSFIKTLSTQGAAPEKKKVTVLHEGSVLAEGSLAQVQANEKVVEVYLGR